MVSGVCVKDGSGPEIHRIELAKQILFGLFLPKKIGSGQPARRERPKKNACIKKGASLQKLLDYMLKSKFIMILQRSNSALNLQHTSQFDQRCKYDSP